MTDTAGATQTLARYVVDAKFADIPDGVRHEARRALLNWLGCAIGTAQHETLEKALAAVAPFAGAPQAARSRADQQYFFVAANGSISSTPHS